MRHGMRHVLTGLAALLLGLTLAIGVSAAAPQQASAKVGMTSVVNKTKKNMSVWCSYGDHGSWFNLKPGENSVPPGKKCGSKRYKNDTDQARHVDKTCLTVGGLGASLKKVKGHWQVPAGDKIKTVDASTYTFEPYSKSKCGSKKKYPLH